VAPVGKDNVRVCYVGGSLNGNRFRGGCFRERMMGVAAKSRWGLAGFLRGGGGGDGSRRDRLRDSSAPG
jgi:hypothetical protein